MVFSEEQGWLVLGEVSSRLHLSDDIVKRTLHSLSCGRFKVLKREGEGSSIRPTDKVRAWGSAGIPYEPRRRHKYDLLSKAVCWRHWVFFRRPPNS